MAANACVTALTEEAVALLVDRMQAHPNLYDTSRLDYRDLAKREISWRDIAKYTGCSVVECKKRWKVIRDRFAREKKRRKIRGDPTFETWPMYDRLSFLLPYVKHRSRTKSSDGSPEPGANGSNDMLMISDEESDLSATSHFVDPGPGLGFTPPPAHERPAPPHTEGLNLLDPGTGASLATAMANLANALPRGEETNGVREMMSALASTFSAHCAADEEELFGRYVAASLKRLPFRGRSLAKLRIQQVLHQVQTFEALPSADVDVKDPTAMLLNGHLAGHFLSPGSAALSVAAVAAAHSFAKAD